MKLLLSAIAAFVLLSTAVARSEEGDPHDAELEQLREQGRRLLEQGALDYERLHQALQAVDERKAAMGANASLAEMDQLAKRAELLRTDIKELKRARQALEEAKAYLHRGRFEAGKQAFNAAVQRWSAVHQRIVAHIGEAPATRRVQPARVGSTPPEGELAALRDEVRSLRAEIQALRAEVKELKGLVQALAR